MSHLVWWCDQRRRIAQGRKGDERLEQNQYGRPDDDPRSLQEPTRERRRNSQHPSQLSCLVEVLRGHVRDRPRTGRARRSTFRRRKRLAADRREAAPASHSRRRLRPITPMRLERRPRLLERSADLERAMRTLRRHPRIYRPGVHGLLQLVRLSVLGEQPAASHEGRSDKGRNRDEGSSAPCLVD
jgi:hypothetical protein